MRALLPNLEGFFVAGLASLGTDEIVRHSGRSGRAQPGNDDDSHKKRGSGPKLEIRKLMRHVGRNSVLWPRIARQPLLPYGI